MLQNTHENAVTTICLRDAIHPSLKVLQNTHENALFGLRDAMHPSLGMLQNTHENTVSTLVAFKTRTRKR